MRDSIPHGKNPDQGQSLSKIARREAIAAYATDMAGTGFDIDPDLEAAGIAHLIATPHAE